MSSAEFDSLILSYQSFLFRSALRFTKNTDDSNDLIQETLYKALKYNEKFQDGTNLKGWLYTIMKNTFINDYRQKKGRFNTQHTSDERYYNGTKQLDRAQKADTSLEMEYLLNQVKSIEKPYLDAFWLFYRGFKYEEIAEILNIPLGTVKSRIFLARQKMMLKLQDYRPLKKKALK